MNVRSPVLVFLLCFCVPSFANFFGADRRVPIATRLFPMSTIGMVKVLNRKNEVLESCTGTLIGKRLVLTARHCTGMLGDGIDPDVSTLFFPSVVAGEMPRGSEAIPAVSGKGGGWRTELDSRQGDWALLVLAGAPRSAELADFGFLEVSSEGPKEGNALIAIGYSTDLAGGATPTVDFDCHVRAVMSDGVFHHDCGTFAGASGGPLLGVFSSSKGRVLKIVGIHTAHKSGGTTGLHLDTYQIEHANLGTSAYLFADNLGTMLRSQWITQR